MFGSKIIKNTYDKYRKKSMHSWFTYMCTAIVYRHGRWNSS